MNDAVRYVWDSAKSHSNWVHRGVAFETAAQLLSSTATCLDQLLPDNRFLTIGPAAPSSPSNLLVVDWQEAEERVVRIHSARRATTNECLLYQDVLAQAASSEPTAAIA